jgi:hypothetical protein
VQQLQQSLVILLGGQMHGWWMVRRTKEEGKQEQAG